MIIWGLRSRNRLMGQVRSFMSGYTLASEHST